MPDFIKNPCGDVAGKCITSDKGCGKKTTNKRFGICDDPPPSTDPAYISEHTNLDEDWVAEVRNDNQKTVLFKAIDNCVPVLRANGELESRCDGLLLAGNDIIFVELKNKEQTGWLSGGRKQITITIEKFIENHNKNEYNWIVAYVCNKQRPFALKGINEEVQKFKDDTSEILDNKGMLLKAERTIFI